MKFELLGTDGRARRGRMSFARGDVETPAFMPVGTYGTVKAMTPEELIENGAQIVLGNTFHLMLRPGMDVIRAHGGLHRFMHWERPILTDSGGFQVFSLATLRKITEEGVSFRSPHNGDPVLLTPERSMQVQRDLDADIAMIFDECTPYPATEEEARTSMELSLRWAERSRAEFARLQNPHALFGIVQGGMFAGLRQESLAGLRRIGFDGYAIGGLAVGEPKEEREAMLDAIEPHMPADRPRYLMGVGTPGGPGRGGPARHGHVRLRHADPACAQRPPVHVDRRAEDPQCALRVRYCAARSGLRLLHVPQLQPRLPAAPRQMRRDSGRAARHHP